MQVEKELAELSPGKDTLLTIGVFDGVHLGHKYLISQLKEKAGQQHLLSGVVTFRQHPQAVMSPQTRLPFLTNLTERIGLLRDEGVGIVVALSFTHGLARLSAYQFVSLLQKYLRMRGLIIGPDFALGLNREGTADNLRALGKDMDFSVNVIATMVINGDIVSSTAIRKALAGGDMKKVCRLLGRPFRLSGQVTTGTGRGIGLGFPTANVNVEPGQALPPDGVYATWTYIGGQAYQSMTNIGKRPTFGGSERTVEVYVLDYDGNLYGQKLNVDIIQRLRNEKHFDTIEALKKQITEDVKQGRTILEEVEAA